MLRDDFAHTTKMLLEHGFGRHALSFLRNELPHLFEENNFISLYSEWVMSSEVKRQGDSSCPMNELGEPPAQKYCFVSLGRDSLIVGTVQLETSMVKMETLDGKWK